MVTHDARYAQHADRIVHLFDGVIVEDEETERQAVTKHEKASGN